MNQCKECKIYYKGNKCPNCGYEEEDEDSNIGFKNETN